MLDKFPPERVVGRMQTPAPCATCGKMTEIAIFTLAASDGSYGKTAICDQCIWESAPIDGVEDPQVTI